MIYKQFNNSPILTNFTTSLQQALSTKKEIAVFVSNYLNLRTAIGYGLDTLGEKVGINRVITSLVFDDKEKIGYKGQDLGNYYNSNYANLSKTGNYRMGDDQYRFVLMMAHFSIATPCTIKGVNLFYKTFFPQSIVAEELMKVTVLIKDKISIIESLLLNRRDLLPIPLGVELVYTYDTNN